MLPEGLRYGSIHIDSILPFELSPHTSELWQWFFFKKSKGMIEILYLGFRTICWFDIVHNINVNVAENDTALRGARLPDDVAKYDARLGGGHLR